MCPHQVVDSLAGAGKGQDDLLRRPGRHVTVDAVVAEYQTRSRFHRTGFMCGGIVTSHTFLGKYLETARLIYMYIVTGRAIHLR